MKSTPAKPTPKMLRQRIGAGPQVRIWYWGKSSILGGRGAWMLLLPGKRVRFRDCGGGGEPGS